MKKDPRLLKFARENRQSDSVIVRRVWAALRAERSGLKWRREQIIGPFIADFYCPIARLALEIDDETHVGREKQDAEKDAFFASEGIEVIRMWSGYFNRSWDDAMSHIIIRAQERIEELRQT